MGKGRGRHNRSGAPGTRTAKAGELIRRVIASELEYIEDERLELVSLTGVDVDRDLHKAVIYFTTFDRDGDPEIDEAFEEYRGRLRHAARIEEILRQEAERPPVPNLDSGAASEAEDGREGE